MVDLKERCPTEPVKGCSAKDSLHLEFGVFEILLVSSDTPPILVIRYPHMFEPVYICLPSFCCVVTPFQLWVNDGSGSGRSEWEEGVVREGQECAGQPRGGGVPDGAEEEPECAAVPLLRREQHQLLHRPTHRPHPHTGNHQFTYTYIQFTLLPLLLLLQLNWIELN